MALWHSNKTSPGSENLCNPERLVCKQKSSCHTGFSACYFLSWGGAKTMWIWAVLLQSDNGSNRLRKKQGQSLVWTHELTIRGFFQLAKVNWIGQFFSVTVYIRQRWNWSSRLSNTHTYTSLFITGLLLSEKVGTTAVNVIPYKIGVSSVQVEEVWPLFLSSLLKEMSLMSACQSKWRGIV